MVKLRLIISGRVQGVGFRWFAQRQAEGYGVVGYAKNSHDGTVEIDAYGEQEALRTLLEDCRKGPRSARVNNIRVEWSDADVVPADFTIR